MIRKALTEDAKKLHLLENSIFQKEDGALGLASFYYHIKNNTFYVYIKNDELAGYILWLERKNHYRLYSLCIHKKFQGQGIGKKLLDFSFKNIKAPKYRLEVKTTNIKAASLYKKYGFKKIKTLKSFYGGDTDAFLMEKDKDC